MSAAVLTTAGTVTCTHTGRVALAASAPILTVAGVGALVTSDLGGASVTCPGVTNTQTGVVQCETVQAPTSGAALLLRVEGTAVVLAGALGMASGAAAGAVPATYSVSAAGQSLLVTS